MKILVAGGRGFIGRALVERLKGSGHDCVVVTRHPRPGTTDISYQEVRELPSEFDAVVNLAGETVVGRWSPRKKLRIMLSRVAPTRTIVEWIAATDPKPKVFLSGSAVGIYGDRPGEKLTEDSPPDPHDAFRAQVCRDWEAAASPAAEAGVRTVILRLGNVLDPSGGYLRQAEEKFRLRPLMILGRPESHFTWVSLEDATRLIEFALNTRSIEGPLNITTPEPTTQKGFAELLSIRLHRPILGTAPPWLLRLILGELAIAITDDQQAVPKKALDAGFRFIHPTLEAFAQTAGPEPL